MEEILNQDYWIKSRKRKSTQVHHCYRKKGLNRYSKALNNYTYRWISRVRLRHSDYKQNPQLVITALYIFTNVEYHNVCLLVRMGLPPTPSRKRVCPPRNKGGGPASEGLGGSNSNDWRKSLVLCLWGYEYWHITRVGLFATPSGRNIILKGLFPGFFLYTWCVLFLSICRLAQKISPAFSS
jgi:hypothetical protein